MRIRGMIVSAAAAALLLVSLAGCSGQGRTERADGFKLQPFPMPLQRFYFPARISGAPQVLITTSASKLGTQTLFGHCIVRGAGMRLSSKPFTLKIYDEIKKEDVLFYATEYLPGDRCLAQSLGVWPDIWASRDAIKLALFDLTTGKGELITPSNIADMSLVQQDVPPRVFYDNAKGVTFLLEDRGTGRIFAYRGGESVHQTDISPKAMAAGFGFVDGKLTYGLVTRKREMMLFDRDSGQFLASEAFKPLAQQVYMTLSVQAGTALNRYKEQVVPMAFAKGFTVMKTDEGIWLLSDAGKLKKLACQPIPGAPVVEYENVMPLDVTLEQALAGRKTGQANPPSQLSQRCNMLAWDEDHVAIFDAEAQRVVLASLDQ